MQMSVTFEDFVDWLQRETHIFTEKSFLNYFSDSYQTHMCEITFFFLLIKSKKLSTRDAQFLVFVALMQVRK